MLPGDAWGPLNGRCAKPSFNSSYVLRGGVVGPEPPSAPHAPIQQQLAWTGESTHAVQPRFGVRVAGFEPLLTSGASSVGLLSTSLA